MRNVVVGVGVAALALVIVSKTVRADVEVGQPIATQTLCKSAAFVEAQVRAVVETGAYDKANALYERDVANGDCVTLPYPATTSIAEVGYVSPVLVDSDGDTVRMSIVRVEAPAPVWTVVFEVLKKAVRS